MAEGVFTSRELEIARMKLGGLTHAQIAKKLGTSKPNVSQTLSRVSAKITRIDDSIKLLKEIGLAGEPASFVLTDKGEELARVRPIGAVAPTIGPKLPAEMPAEFARLFVLFSDALELTLLASYQKVKLSADGTRFYRGLMRWQSVQNRTGSEYKNGSRIYEYRQPTQAGPLESEVTPLTMGSL